MLIVAILLIVAKAAKKEPDFVVKQNRAYNWRRPTLTGPITPLPSALQRFTSGFGMGPGGSAMLWPPEDGLCESLNFCSKKNSKRVF